MHVSTALSLLFLIYATTTTSQNTTTHYIINKALLQSYLFQPYPASPNGAPAGQDSASKFEFSTQGTNPGALPVNCSLAVENPGNRLEAALLAQTIPFRCTDKAVTAIWTRTNVSGLNGEVTVQLAGAQPAQWQLGTDWTHDYAFEPWSSADVESWVFVGPLVI